MELIREIMLQAESGETGACPPIAIEGYAPNHINYHCHLIVKMGLAVGTDNSDRPNASASCELVFLTPEGHDFIDAVRDETVWKRTLGLIKAAVTSVSFDLWMQIASHYAKEQMGLKKE